MATNACIPDLELQERVLNKTEEWYAPVRWKLPDNYLSKEVFKTVLRRLDFSSSPGYPYCKRKQTIGEWLGFDGFQFDPVQVDLLWMDVQRAILGESELIMRVFIKQEPHKAAKAVEGRWRLIMAFPLAHQVLWHMLFDYMNDLEITKAAEIPSQQGIVLYGGAWKSHLARWKQQGYDTGLDKSAWDWTYTYWLMQMDLQLRYRTGRGFKMMEWFQLATREYELAFGVGAKFITTDGYELEQLVPGLMKSGSVNTISSNSHAQAMLHALVCIEGGVDPDPYPACCGDDTLQKMSQALIPLYEKYGVVVKSASEGMEFIGHEFLDSGPQPLYMRKHLNRFLHMKDEYLGDYLDGMSRLYAKTPYFEFWSWLGDVYDVPVPSKQYVNNWYDHSY